MNLLCSGSSRKRWTVFACRAGELAGVAEVGCCDGLGMPKLETQNRIANEIFAPPTWTKEDIGLGWQKLLGAVRTYADLEPALLGRVEEVIDFLTVP